MQSLTWMPCPKTVECQNQFKFSVFLIRLFFPLADGFHVDFRDQLSPQLQPGHQHRHQPLHQSKKQTGQAQEPSVLPIILVSAPSSALVASTMWSIGVA